MNLGFVKKICLKTPPCESNFNHRKVYVPSPNKILCKAGFYCQIVVGDGKLNMF